MGLDCSPSPHLVITRQALDQACDQAEKFARAFIDSQKGKAYFTKLALERVMEDQKQGKIDDNKRMVQLQFSILRAKQQVKFDVRAAGTCKWWGLDAPVPASVANVGVH